MNPGRGDAPEPLAGTLFESRGLDEEPMAVSNLQRGGTLSRYLLVDRVGAGGMGVVWAAYDPELDRKVAIKLLRPRRSEGRDAEARTRLVREAQAMARLSHPNVIAVHDVGEHDGQVFVAMEFVEGRTLGRWVRSTRHGWREIVAMFIQAGRGLAEAHRAGLVHRDFKPENVLIGDGRARVTDFGLARSVETITQEPEGRPRSSEPESGLESGLESGPVLATPLTRTGTMVGTPAYMAPEQFESGQFDARSDQFSFCVALWEALYGQRPFAGLTLVELGESVRAGRIGEPPSEAKVPSFIDKALRRGLSVDPGERWISMDALLHELARDPAMGRRRWAVAGAVVASFGAAMVLTPLMRTPEPDSAPACPDAQVHLEGVWDAGRRAQLEGVIMTSGVAEPKRVWAQLSAGLDGYASSWLAMHHDACAATHVRHEQSQELLDLRMRCLDQGRLSLAATVALLAEGGVEPGATPTQLLAGLPPVEPCGRRAYLEAVAPIPADEALAVEVARLREELAEAKARVDFGEAEAMLPRLRELVADAEATGYAPIEAEALSELAFASGGVGSSEETRALLERAVVESIRTGLDAQAARAGIELSYVVGVRLKQRDEGLRWTERVAAWQDRLEAGPLDRARIGGVRGMILGSRMELDAAELELREALSLLGLDESLAGLDGLGPAQSVAATWILATRAEVAYRGGEFQAAVRSSRAAASLAPRVHGAGSESADTFELGDASLGMIVGNWRESEAVLDRIRPGIEARCSADPLACALTRINLLELRVRTVEAGLAPLDSLADADELAAAGEAAVAEAFAEAPGRRASALAVVASYARVRGRPQEAAAILARAEAALAEDDSPRADRVMAVGLERVRQVLAGGDGQAARAELDRLRVVAEAAGLFGRPALAELLTLVARIELEAGNSDAARAALEQSIALWDALAPRGHPEVVAALELLAQLDPVHAEALTERAQGIRAVAART